jgi:hypothetical protein
MTIISLKRGIDYARRKGYGKVPSKPRRKRAPVGQRLIAAQTAAKLEADIPTPTSPLGAAAAAQRARTITTLQPLSKKEYEREASDFILFCRRKGFPEPEPRKPLSAVALAE